MDKINIYIILGLLFLSSTVMALDYQIISGEPLFVFVMKSDGNYEDNAFCMLTSWYGDSSVVLDSVNMTFLGNGTYDYNDTLALDTGFYDAVIICNSSEGYGSTSFVYRIIPYQERLMSLYLEQMNSSLIQLLSSNNISNYALSDINLTLLDIDNMTTLQLGVLQSINDSLYLIAHPDMGLYSASGSVSAIDHSYMNMPRLQMYLGSPYTENKVNYVEWISWLDRVFGVDGKFREYMQRAIDYIIGKVSSLSGNSGVVSCNEAGGITGFLCNFLQLFVILDDIIYWVLRVSFLGLFILLTVPWFLLGLYGLINFLLVNYWTILALVEIYIMAMSINERTFTGLLYALVVGNINMIYNFILLSVRIVEISSWILTHGLHFIFALIRLVLDLINTIINVIGAFAKGALGAILGAI